MEWIEREVPTNAGVAGTVDHNWGYAFCHPEIDKRIIDSGSFPESDLSHKRARWSELRAQGEWRILPWLDPEWSSVANLVYSKCFLSLPSFLAWKQSAHRLRRLVMASDIFQRVWDQEWYLLEEVVAQDDLARSRDLSEQASSGFCETCRNRKRADPSSAQERPQAKAPRGSGEISHGSSKQESEASECSNRVDPALMSGRKRYFSTDGGDQGRRIRPRTLPRESTSFNPVDYGGDMYYDQLSSDSVPATSSDDSVVSDQWPGDLWAGDAWANRDRSIGAKRPVLDIWESIVWR